MAPPEMDGAEKYKDLTVEDLMTECKKRGIEIPPNIKKDDLILLLNDNDKKPPDWGKIYSKLLYHYHLDYDSIQNRTIPQVDALTRDLPEHISIARMSIPGLFGLGSIPEEPNLEQPSAPPDKPPKLSQFMAFANAFD